MTTYDDAADRVAPAGATHDALLLLARVALSAIFVQSGFGKVADLGGFTAGMAGQGVPLAAVTAPLGAFAELLGGLAVLLGAWTRPAALVLAAFTVAASVIAHRFWEYPADQQMMQTVQLMKNLAIVGGFLALAVAGGGRFSVDGFRLRRRRA